MPKKTYTSLPPHYAVCEHSDCPQAKNCLHRLAYPELAKKEDYLYLINPDRCTKDGKCRFYRDNKPVIYARGFTNFQKRMYPNQYQKFMSIMIGIFGRNPYFERRRGETLLSPDEQKTVLDALRKAGITEEFKFDKYETIINWYD